MSRGVLTRTNAGNAVAAFGIFVLVLLWLGVAWDLGRDRARVLHQAEADTTNLARAFEEHIQRTIAGLDQTMLYMAAEYQRDPDRFTLADAAKRAVILRNVSVQMAVIGADGILVDSTIPGVAGMDLSDREHFRVHRQARNDFLFISKPLLGRASGKWSIQMTRRLQRADGGFAGVLVLSLDPLYLSGFYGSIDVGAKGSILLIGRDGIIRAASDGSVGRAVTAAGLTDAMFSAGAGIQHVAGPVDNEPRIASFRVLTDQPLAVWVGRSQAEVLALHADTERTYLSVGAAVTLVLGVALLMLYRLVHRQEAIAHDLAVKKAELLASRERLRRYVADLERIAEVAAHDLQEPLRRVVAYTQLLANHAEAVLDAESRDYVAHVVAGAQRMRKLVQDLEAFVAVDHLPAAEAVIPASAAMAAAAERLAEEVRKAGASLMIGALPEVAAEEKSLTEIFTQLVDNALRYRCEDRKLLIHVSARRDGDQAVFSVRDNGMGIEGRYLPRLFEIFHRLQGIDGRPGTGMGLAIVRRMVERLGGRVWVDSQAGEGSTFSFTLPLQVQKLTSLEQEAQAA
jgi:two-component system, sensor histidine kinase